MLNWAKSKLESAFKDLAEAQKGIDESARKIVDSITRMIDIVPDEAPSSRSALAGRDFTWYDEVAGTLTRDGFGAPARVETRAWMSRPAEERTLSEYAIGDGGAVVASWFQMAPKGGALGKKILSLTTVTEDGAQFHTVQNAAKSRLPHRPTVHEEHVDEQVPLSAVLAGHRARVARHGSPPRRFAGVGEYQEWQRDAYERTARFRRDQGLSLIERYLETYYTGDKAEVGREYLKSIRAHPEWYKYSAGRPSEDGTGGTPAEAAEPDSPEPAMPLNFLASASDGGRRTLTSFGMLFAGVPELIVRGVAANHSRAARVLLATTARAIARRRSALAGEGEFLAALVSSAGMRLVLLPEDVVSTFGAPLSASQSSAPVHVSLQGFDSDDDEPSLLGIDPLPGTPGSLDERLRALCARLGCEVPVAAPAESMEAAMDEAHRGAVAQLAGFRARFQAGLGAGQKVCVKVRVVVGDVGEYVWLEVLDWRQDEIEGIILTPAPRVDLAGGQRLVIAETRIYDYIDVGPEGILTPSATDLVAIDYGMDI